MGRILVWVAMAFAMDASAQDRLLKPERAEEKIGENFIRGQAYRAQSVHLNYEVDDMVIDSASATMLLTLHENDQQGRFVNQPFKYRILALDANTLKLLWQLSYNGFTESYEVGTNALYIKSALGTKRYHLRDGLPMWSSRLILVHENEDLMRGIGMKRNSRGTLYGVDLQTGRTLWKRNLPKPDTWTDLHYYNDSTIVIAATGMHKINLNTGDGWNYTKESALQDQRQRILNQFEKRSASNVYYNYNGIFYASNGILTRLDYTGKAIWETALPVQRGNQAFVFAKDTVVILLNTGVCTNYYKKPLTSAYAGVYCMESGREISFRNFPDSLGCMANFQPAEDTLLLLFNHGMGRLNIRNWEIIGNKFLDAGGELLGVARADLAFQAADSSKLRYLTERQEKKLGIILSDGSAYELDHWLNKSGNWHVDQSFMNKRLNKYLIVADGKSTQLLLGNDLEPIGKLEGCNGFQVHGNHMYFYKGSTLFKVELSEVMGINSATQQAY